MVGPTNVEHGVDRRGGKTEKANASGFVFFFFNRETDPEKLGFGLRKPTKKTPEKNDCWFSVHKPGDGTSDGRVLHVIP